MKKILSIAAIMMASFTYSLAQDVCIDDIYYFLDKDTREAEVTYDQVTEALYYGSVVVPETITVNGTIYTVTRIGEYTFCYSEGLTSISMPKTLTYIGQYAFGACTGLTSIVIPEAVKTIDQYAFCYCNGLTSVVIPDAVKTIGKHAFEDCKNLTSLTLGNSLTNICDSAFNWCKSLESLHIPKSVEDIGKGAFLRCHGLTHIDVENGNKNYDSRDNCNALIDSKTNELIQGSSNTVIPNTVTKIDDYAFWYSNLNSISIPNSVVTIGDGAFQGCRQATSLKLSNSLTTIGDYAFYYCLSLTSIALPSSVTSIGKHSFSCTSVIKSITVESGNKNFDSRDNCNALIDSRTNTLVRGCDNTVIPNTVTKIGDYAFELNTIKSIELPGSVTIIGRGAFCYSDSLRLVTLGNGITTIESSAFEACAALTSVTIGNTVSEIGTHAFALCPKLNTVYCYALDVPHLEGEPFYYDYLNMATLYVPESSLEAYKTADGWKDFSNILPLEGSAINAVPDSTGSADGTQVLFDLSGRRLHTSQKGINIIKGRKFLQKNG